MIGRLTKNSPYTGVVEEVSTVAVDFLGASIFIDQAHRRIRWSPPLKSTALRSILTLNSAHPSRIHESWMRAYFHRLMRRSSNPEIYRSYQDEVLKRLVEAGIDHSLLAHLRAITSCTYPVPISGRPCSSVVKNDRTFWCVVPCHPIWFKALSAAARRFSLRLRVQPSPSIGQRVSCAWDLDSPVLSTAISRF